MRFGLFSFFIVTTVASSSVISAANNFDTHPKKTAACVGLICLLQVKNLYTLLAEVEPSGRLSNYCHKSIIK